MSCGASSPHILSQVWRLGWASKTPGSQHQRLRETATHQHIPLRLLCGQPTPTIRLTVLEWMKAFSTTAPEEGHPATESSWAHMQGHITDNHLAHSLQRSLCSGSYAPPSSLWGTKEAFNEHVLLRAAQTCERSETKPSSYRLDSELGKNLSLV